MGDFGTYHCKVESSGLVGEAIGIIGAEALEIKAEKSTLRVDFADMRDFRLMDYHIILDTSNGKVELSQLGFQTEDFFEKLWQAYAQRSREALFVEGEALYTGEGDYYYTEQGVEAHGIAKVELHDDCMCLFPHNDKARRIPLCFADAPYAADFQISLKLDTGDSYRVSRLGRSFDAVAEKIVSTQKKTAQRWQKAHSELSDNLGERLGADAGGYDWIKAQGCRMIDGLYTPDDEGFWFAGIKNGKAAVEWVTEEQTATYLYQFQTDDTVFERSLRHALESSALHREVIFTELNGKPLYQMTVHRSYHLRFLRQHFAGRIIHNSMWQERVKEFFQ